MCHAARHGTAPSNELRYARTRVRAWAGSSQLKAHLARTDAAEALASGIGTRSYCGKSHIFPPRRGGSHRGILTRVQAPGGGRIVCCRLQSAHRCAGEASAPTRARIATGQKAPGTAASRAFAWNPQNWGLRPAISRKSQSVQNEKKKIVRTRKLDPLEDPLDPHPRPTLSTLGSHPGEIYCILIFCDHSYAALERLNLLEDFFCRRSRRVTF